MAGRRLAFGSAGWTARICCSILAVAGDRERTYYLKSMAMRTIGVVGAGVMGRGVAQDLAQAGYDVVLIDVSDEVLERARDEIRNNTRLYRMLHPDARKVGVSDVLGRIRFSTAFDVLEKVDFVI